MDNPNREQVTQWAIAFAQAILKVDASAKYKLGFLKNCVWMVTEADGKYNVPYWSDKVYELVQAHNGDLKAVLKPRHTIRHEHVNQIKRLVKKIMADHNCLEEVLRKEAIACLVTVDEHKRLHQDKSLEGFARYKAAGIRVWDVEAEDWLRIE